MHRPTNKPRSYVKNQVSLTYFTGQNRPPKKWAWIGIFKPAEPHSPYVVICSFNVFVKLSQSILQSTFYPDTHRVYNYFKWTQTVETRWRIVQALFLHRRGSVAPCCTAPTFSAARDWDRERRTHVSHKNCRGHSQHRTWHTRHTTLSPV